MFSLYIYNIYNIYNNHLYISGLAYVGEKDEEGTMFDSMPTALYWAIITMTSVGYGDIHPVSWFGKLVGSGQFPTFIILLNYVCKRIFYAEFDGSNNHFLGPWNSDSSL